jgi:hypothetical protein
MITIQRSHSSLRFALYISAASMFIPLVWFDDRLEAADESRKAQEDEARREEQLKGMLRSAAQYTVTLGDDRKRQLKLNENAVIRFSNPVGVSKDGAIYVWTANGRPEAILKLYTTDNTLFSHEWQSLSEETLIAKRDGAVMWNPSEPGLTYSEMPDAPKPAETAADRLRQMKALAGKFSSSYTNNPKEDPRPTDMRLLVQPLFRFQPNKETNYLDGAIFGYSVGTAPMNLLLLEARRIGESYKWHYAFARLATGQMSAKLGDKEVFSAQRYDFRVRDSKKTFLLISRQSIPKD